MCTIKPFIVTDVCSQNSFALSAPKFVHLQQLKLMNNDNRQAPCLLISTESQQAYPVLFSQFPSLVGCVAHTRNAHHIVDIITKCKHLKYFTGEHLSVHNHFLLHQTSSKFTILDIDFRDDIDEVFMESVSAHGKLEIVFLTVVSLTEAGISALIENSPKLCIFKIIFTEQLLLNDEVKQLKTLKDTLKKKLIHRKLFNLDGFTILVDVKDKRLPINQDERQ